jgi:hypothetical protein
MNDEIAPFGAIFAFEKFPSSANADSVMAPSRYLKSGLPREMVRDRAAAAAAPKAEPPES